MVEQVMSPAEEISVHLVAAQSALRQKKKQVLIEQLTLALQVAENEEL